MTQQRPGARAVKLFATLMLSSLAAMPAHATAPPATLIPVKIGYPQTNHWTLLVARDLKLFEQAGLAPSFHPFTTGAPLVAGMKNSELDVAWTGLSTLTMLNKGIPLKILFVPADHSGQQSMVVTPKSGIKSYRDLKKANAIGAPSGTCGEVSAVWAAKKAGTSIAALKFSNLAPNLLQGAMQNDQIDAAFIWGPWDLRLREAGFKIVGHDKDYVPGGSACAATVSIRPEFLQQHPGVACKLVKAHALALEAARKDPEATIRMIQKELNLDYTLAKASFETLVFPSLKAQLTPHSPWSLVDENGGLAKRLQLASDALYEAKSFAQPLAHETIRQAIDASYIKQYLETDCR